MVVFQEDQNTRPEKSHFFNLAANQKNKKKTLAEMGTETNSVKHLFVIRDHEPFVYLIRSPRTYLFDLYWKD